MLVHHKLEDLLGEVVIIPEHGLDREFDLLDFEGIAPPIVLSARTDRAMHGEGQGLVLV
jgi:hypothetical protein